MQDRIFGDREKAAEEAYFRQADARLLETLRQKAHLDDIAVALGQKLQVDNPVGAKRGNAGTRLRIQRHQTIALADIEDAGLTSVGPVRDATA